MNLYIFNLLCFLDFQMLKKYLENLFSSYHKVNFRKKCILAILRIIFQKINIISNVIISTAAALKIFSTNFLFFFAKFHVKSIFLSGFMQGEHYMPPLPRGMIRQKCPGADRVKKIKTKHFSGCILKKK